MIVFFEYVNLNYAHFCEYLTVAVPFTLVFITGETMAMACLIRATSLNYDCQDDGSMTLIVCVDFSGSFVYCDSVYF